MSVITIADLQEAKESVEQNLADVCMMLKDLKVLAHVGTPEAAPTGEWVVVEHGDPESDDWEISVCVSGTHGCVSYGWPGDEKHIVWSEGGPCGDTPHPLLVDSYRRIACELADKLNAAG